MCSSISIQLPPPSSSCKFDLFLHALFSLPIHPHAFCNPVQGLVVSYLLHGGFSRVKAAISRGFVTPADPDHRNESIHVVKCANLAFTFRLCTFLLGQISDAIHACQKNVPGRIQLGSLAACTQPATRLDRRTRSADCVSITS